MIPKKLIKNAREPQRVGPWQSATGKNAAGLVGNKGQGELTVHSVHKTHIKIHQDLGPKAIVGIFDSPQSYAQQQIAAQRKRRPQIIVPGQMARGSIFLLMVVKTRRKQLTGCGVSQGESR